MKSSLDPFERIVASLHEAALDDARWSDVDRLIGETNGTSGSALGLFVGTSPADLTAFLARICVDGERRSDWERRYFEEYFAADERVPRFLRQEHGRIVATEDLYTDVEKKMSPTYNEALADMKAQDSVHVRMDCPNGLSVMWITHDPMERRGWSFEQIGLIRRLRPHVRQSVLVSHALAEAAVTGTSTAQLLASPHLGVIHLDRRGRIMTANDRALKILRRGDGLADEDGLLCTRMPVENAELSRLLARALPPFGMQGSAGSMAVTRSSSSPFAQFALHVTPVGDDYPHFRTRRLGAIVLVVDPTSRIHADPDHVGTVLGLAPMESRLAVALAAGQTLQDFARENGTSYETSRWQLKQIFRKLDISRQVDLVRQVLSLESFGAISCQLSGDSALRLEDHSPPSGIPSLSNGSATPDPSRTR